MIAPKLPSVPPIWRESRLALEAMSLLRSDIWRGQGMADGEGQPVLLIPGFLAGDNSLGLMTMWLRRSGYHTSRAGIRANVGCSGGTLDRLIERLDDLAERQGRRVAIVGQSRGGQFAKVLAVRRPDLVSGIVTLGTPAYSPRAIHPLVQAQVLAVGVLGTIGAPGLLRHQCRNGECCRSFKEDLRGEFPEDIGYLSIYSRSDGIVYWRTCLDAAAEHLEVEASHCGMSVNPRAYRAIAATLENYRLADERGFRPEAVKAA